MFKVNGSKIIVAYPQADSGQIKQSMHIVGRDEICRFFYASIPRLYKNFEVICEAVKVLNGKGCDNFEVSMTIGEFGDKYSQLVYGKYKDTEHINFLGFITGQQLSDNYDQCDCMLFPSKCETWGLPISEFIQYNKPMLLADLPYAHETSIGSSQTAFFNQNDPQDLADKMLKIINKDYSFLQPVESKQIDNPFTQSWAELFNILLNE
jgi:glycosyltransferase involved in cell wall biosynthesis